MDYNGELNRIDTEEKAYFLGFAYADGCISKKTDYNGFVFRMSLTDKDIIYKLQEIFPFFNIDTFDYSKYNKNYNRQYAIRKVSTELYNDLVKNGLLERKSGENCENLKFPQLTKNLIPHFIRGYFDGDGSINISKQRPNLRRVEICSGSKNFLLEIKENLEKFDISCPIFREKFNNKSPLYVLEWINTKDIFSLKKLFYNNSTIFLNRKKEKFDSFSVINRKDENPLCPICFSQSRKSGTRQMKHGLMYRYNCISCLKKFSIPAPCKKQDELSGKPCEGNQQPSLDSNIFEGSTTNSRVQTSNVEDSNADTSVLPIVIERDVNGNALMSVTFKIIDFGDDIV